MRVSLLGLFGALCLIAILPATAEAAPLAPNQAIVAPAPKSVIIAQKCGKGYHWVPAGYAKKGKWRSAHCARN
jgi:hypothetical protein